MNRANVLDRIGAILAAVTTPIFETVYRGEPLSIPQGDRVAAYWYLGDMEPPEGTQTLGNRMVYERFQICCYWRAQSSVELREAAELEAWEANRAIHAALVADSDLDEEATDLDVTNGVTGWVLIQLGGVPLRFLSMELRVKDLEAEGVGL